MNMNKYQKSRPQIMIESLVRFNDFKEYTFDNFKYENLILPKNLLLLLGMNEVNGFIKNGKFSRFTHQDNFIQFHTGIVLGNIDSVYISINNQMVDSDSLIDEINKGSLFIPNYDGNDKYGYTCAISIMNTIKHSIPYTKGSKTDIVYKFDECTVSRLTNYADNKSYYSDEDLCRLYRCISRDFINEVPENVINELQKELSAMCEFIHS